MNIAVVGVGGAGCRIADRLAARHGFSGGSPLSSGHAIDTDRKSLTTLAAIPEDSRQLLGQYETGGEGTDGDREIARTILEEEGRTVRREVEDGIASTVDAIILIAGLGGGTAAAFTPAIAEGLATIYEQPVYTVSILPDSARTTQQVARNTGDAMRTLESSVETQILFDNDLWLWGDRSLESHAESLNAVLIDRLSTLLMIGMIADATTVGQRVVDTNDVIETLSGGGYTTLGFASKSVADWRGVRVSALDRVQRRLLGDNTQIHVRATAISRTLAWATRGTLTFECPRDAPDGGLVVFYGPPSWLIGDAIARGQDWLADRTAVSSLRSGDVPVADASSVDVFVVLTGITDAPRIQGFKTDE